MEDAVIFMIDSANSMDLIPEKNKHNNNWKFVQEEIKMVYGLEAYHNWIECLTLEHESNSQIVLKSPSKFIRDWVVNYYINAIRNIWQKFDPTITWVHVYYDYNADHNPSPTSIKQNEEKQEIPVVQNVKATANNNQQTSVLDPRYTFESFVVGQSNEFAYAAARAICNPNAASNFEYNPLFFYSPIGHGKTHLMHAIAWEITNNYPEKKLYYLSAEKFMLEFVRSLKNKDMLEFKEQFRSVDILMIDDLQFLCGKETTQIEFFNTFNSLLDGNKRIILACDRAPTDLDDIDARFKSKLGCGLVADISHSDYDLRIQILTLKIKLQGVNISFEVLEFLAQKITNNIRELEGALNKVVAYATLMNKPVDIDKAKEILKDVLRTSSKNINIDYIQQKVADFFKIKVTDILSSSRERKLARPRQIAMYLCKKMTNSSLVDIGRKFGGRDHTTVMHAIKQVDELIIDNIEVSNNLTSLEKLINN